MKERTSKCCPGCKVQPGQKHEEGCDLEQCPNCGLQLILCDCSRITITHRLPWMGEPKGFMECREFGWFACWDGGKGWLRCSPNDIGAWPDLNRLYSEAEWCPLQQRFILTTRKNMSFS